VNRDQKAAVIEEVATQIRESQAVYAVDYRGVSVQQVGDLRRRLVEADAVFRIVKNTLTERAADQAGADGLRGVLDGPTALTFVRGDAALAAKALAIFRRETNLLEFKGGTLEGDVLSVEQIESIARLPARDVLQGQFVGVLAAPITGLVRGLGGLLGGLAVALGQIQEKGLVGNGGAPVETPATVEETSDQEG
jgi:large subunit ribosomal protein L10